MTTPLPSGVYVIRHVATQTVVDLSAGSSDDNTPVQAWHFLNFDDVYAYDQFWYILRVPGRSYPTYTINNLKSGTVLEIAGGSSDNGTQAQCSAAITDLNDPHIIKQYWLFDNQSSNTYAIMNTDSGTTLDLSNGGSADGTKIQGWQFQPGNTNQVWAFERRTNPEGN